MSLSIERAVAGLTLRQMLARRRALVLLALGMLPLLPALLARGAARAELPMVEIYMSLVIPVLLPLAALVMGTGAFGGEIEDGTILFLLAKPIARWRLVLVRTLVSALVSAALIAPGALLSGVILAGGVDAGRVALAVPAALCAGALVYSALFVALSLATRRALVMGLIYVVLWEGIVAGRFAATRLLSVRQFVLTLADRLSSTHPTVFDAPLPPLSALVMGTVVTLMAGYVAVRGLQRFEISET